MKKISVKQLFTLFIIVLLALGVIVSRTLVKQSQEIRKKAAEVQGSKLTLVGPNQVKAGEKFSVNILLDTTNDPNFTISGVDTVVSVNSSGTSPTCAPRVCPLYDLLPNFCQGGQIIYPAPSDPCSCAPPPKCVGLPLSGQEMELTRPMPPIYKVEPVSLLNVYPGKIFDNYPTVSGVGEGGSGGVVPGESCVGPGCPRLETGGGGGSSQVSVTGAVVDMSKLPSPNPAVECPPFPGCPPEGSLMPWNICWGDGEKLCPQPTKGAGGFRLMEIACTDDAKQCPDGSWVGRTGPNCEFTPCPGSGTPIPIPNPPFYGGNQFKISGAKNFAVDEKGYFNGFTGSGIFATLNFVANTAGKVEIALANTSIKGYVANQPANTQTPQERLLVAPQSLNIEVVSTGCYYQQIQCFKEPCEQILVCPSTAPGPTESTCDNSTGDADCNSKVDLADFEVWRKEFTGEQKTKKANFSRSGKTGLVDFEIWRNRFFQVKSLILF